MNRNLIILLEHFGYLKKNDYVGPSISSWSNILGKIDAYMGPVLLRTTGIVTFSDAIRENIVLAEASTATFEIAPDIDGKSEYVSEQSWHTSPGEALYGGGEYQNGLLDYKGMRVLMACADVAMHLCVCVGVGVDNRGTGDVGSRNHFGVSNCSCGGDCVRV